MTASEADQRDYIARFGGGVEEAFAAAHKRSEEHGVPAVPADVGTALRFFASIAPAKQAVEIGTGAGYSGLCLLAGMDPRGILTTIEADRTRRSLAQETFSDGGVSDRVRSISGSALEVLPRLAEDTYDLAFCDAVKSEYPQYLAHALRLLRPGGLLLADNVLWHGRVADPDDPGDADTHGLREFNDAVRDDPRLTASILPAGDGLLAAVVH